jgi:hypothetical protein
MKETGLPSWAVCWTPTCEEYGPQTVTSCDPDKLPTACSILINRIMPKPSLSDDSLFAMATKRTLSIKVV